MLELRRVAAGIHLMPRHCVNPAIPVNAENAVNPATQPTWP